MSPFFTVFFTWGLPLGLEILLKKCKFFTKNFMKLWQKCLRHKTKVFFFAFKKVHWIIFSDYRYILLIIRKPRILRFQKLIQCNHYVLITWNVIILRTRLARVLTVCCIWSSHSTKFAIHALAFSRLILLVQNYMPAWTNFGWEFSKRKKI